MSVSSVDGSVSDLTLIEKITNLTSMLMIFVVLLMTDISLVENFNKNLFTYSWYDVKIHLGKTAVTISGWLFFYVIVSPLVSAFVVWFVRQITQKYNNMIDNLLKEKNIKNNQIGQDMYMHAERLKGWAVENSDSMALALAQDCITQHAKLQEKNRKTHIALSAFILLVIWSYFVPSTLCGAFLVSIVESSNQFKLVFFLVLTFMVVLFWWSTRFFSIYDDHQAMVRYPKAFRESK